jgi:hypothetical protein
MKAMARPHHVGQLVNRHRANSAITTDTVASRHTMPWCGDETMMMTIPGHALMLGQDSLPCKSSILVSPSLRLLTIRSGEPLSVCNLTLGLYIRIAGPPIQGDRLSRLHSSSPSLHFYLFPLAYTPYCKNFRVVNWGTRTRSSLRLDIGLWPEPVWLLVSLDATIVFLEQCDTCINSLVNWQNTAKYPIDLIVKDSSLSPSCSYSYIPV